MQQSFEFRYTLANSMTLISLEYDQSTKTASLANLKGNHMFKPHYVISV